MPYVPYHTLHGPSRTQLALFASLVVPGKSRSVPTPIPPACLPLVLSALRECLPLHTGHMRPAGSSIKRVCRPSSPLLLPTLLLLQRPHSSATTTNYNFQPSAQTSNHTATMPTYIASAVPFIWKLFPSGSGHSANANSLGHLQGGCLR